MLNFREGLNFMCFDNTCNLKQVANLILCWFRVFSPLAFSFLFDFWSHCLAFGTVRKQFSPESKLVLHHELFSSTHRFLQQAPCALPTTESEVFPFAHSSLHSVPCPLLLPPSQMATQQAGTLAPGWICCVFKFPVTQPPSSCSASECNHMRQAVSM